MPLIPEVINERKLWVIMSTRKRDDSGKELEIIRPMVEKLNTQWFEKGDLSGQEVLMMIKQVWRYLKQWKI